MFGVRQILEVSSMGFCRVTVRQSVQQIGTVTLAKSSIADYIDMCQSTFSVFISPDSSLNKIPLPLGPSTLISTTVIILRFTTNFLVTFSEVPSSFVHAIFTSNVAW